MLRKRKRKDKSSEGRTLLFNGKRYKFEESNAALCVPEELRRSFRRLSRIDRSVRPSSPSTIFNVFSRCCSVGGKKEEESSIFGKEEVEKSCIVWTTKQEDSDPRFLKRGTSQRNVNMNVWLNGENKNVRSVMYEWFVGPKQLSDLEIETYTKRRGRSRKRGRRIKAVCDNAGVCINPFHLVSSSPLGEDVARQIENEPRGVSSSWVNKHLEEDCGKSNAKRKLDNAYISSMFILNSLGIT